MGEIPANTFRRYREKGASLVYMRMESTDLLLYKDIFIRERGYDERVRYELSGWMRYRNIEKLKKEQYEVKVVIGFNVGLFGYVGGFAFPDGRESGRRYSEYEAVGSGWFRVDLHCGC